MILTLEKRTEETVRIYYEKSQQPFIKSVLPQKAQSIEEALADYRNTLLPSASSYGKTIFADGQYIGDIWCYCIDLSETPNAMLSFCIFDKNYWNQGIATEAASMFLQEITAKYKLKSIGAFTYAENHASRRVLEKNGFQLAEEFIEDGKQSVYLQKG